MMTSVSPPVHLQIHAAQDLLPAELLCTPRSSMKALEEDSDMARFRGHASPPMGKK